MLASFPLSLALSDFILHAMSTGYLGTLVIVARRLVPGLTKTRLAADLGHEAACFLSRAFLEDLIERLAPLTDLELVLAWGGSREGALELSVPANFRVAEQGEGDLGQRMARLFWEAAPPVVFIGSDAPTLPLSAIREAFDLLAAGYEAVFQPALDGGYTLAGFGASPEPFFAGTPWGTGGVLEATFEAAKSTGARLAMLDPWYDLDVPANLELLERHLPVLEGTTSYPHRTVDVLRGLRWRR